MAEKATPERDAQALSFALAGLTVEAIRDQMKFRSVIEVDAAIKRARKRAPVNVDPLSIRNVEMERLDRLQQAVWLKALRGDPAAIDRVLKIGELRLRYAGIADTEVGRSTKAFNDAVGTLRLKPADAALVDAGRRIAERIDQSFASGDQLAETKALYLVPHLMNVLRELGATPAVRGEFTAVVEGVATHEPKVNDLTAFREKRGIVS